jgi:hypothetical protein
MGRQLLRPSTALAVIVRRTAEISKPGISLPFTQRKSVMALETQTSADTKPPENDEATPTPAARRRVRLLTIGAAAFVAAALIVAGLLFATRDGSNTGNAAAKHHHATVPVAYRVAGHGTAQISYAGPDGKLHTVSAHLPWRGDTKMAAAAPAVVSITLGKDGGHATCTVTRHGKVVQQATAYGSYGRANCRTATGR